MPERLPFEEIVKAHIAEGKDVHSAFGRAIQEDPEAYARYLNEQRLIEKSSEQGGGGDDGAGNTGHSGRQDPGA